MTAEPTSHDAFDISFDARFRLEELVDKKGLAELGRNVFTLFGIPLRIFNADNVLVAEAGAEHELCAAINTEAPGRKACGAMVASVRSCDPDRPDLEMPCFSGLSYRVFALEYEGRRVGKLVLGPFALPQTQEAPESLTKVVTGQDKKQLTLLVTKVPHAKADTLTRIATHIKATLDLILFSGHKALVTSTMHLATVTDNYRQLEEKNRNLQVAYDRLKELDRLKSNFLGTVSHELRTPLTSIIGYSEMLAEGITGELNPEQTDFVTTIHEKGEQLLQLITSLLDLSKLESGTMAMRRKLSEIHPVLAEVQSTCLPNALKKGVKLVLDLDPQGCELSADPERLRQVFINLVDNAIKFTPKDGTVTIETRVIDDVDGDDATEGFSLLSPMDKSVRVRVLDTGIGIPAHERPKVFDPFYQVDSSSTREYGGTGLGLSIVKRLVEGHGGTVGIEANEPTGAVFVVVLPSAATSRSQKSSLPPPLFR
jgi:signal transduction histidine kinase